MQGAVIFVALALPAFVASANAAPPPSAHSDYNPLAAFAPLDMPQAVNRYRSANGAPGPDYWQNRADYLVPPPSIRPPRPWPRAPTPPIPAP